MVFLLILVFCLTFLPMTLIGVSGQSLFLKNIAKQTHFNINSIIYTEVSIGFEKIEEAEQAISELGLKVIEMPREALFLTGKAFVKYRRNKGTKNSPLPDFFIGAHSAVSEFNLITRDLAKYKTYFPQVKLIHPEMK